MKRMQASQADSAAHAAVVCSSQAEGAEKEQKLNGKKDGVLPDKSQSRTADGADIQQLEAKGEVSPEGQGAAQAAQEYLGAPLPPNEEERHETLCACQILDTAPDPRFDDITKLVRPPSHALSSSRHVISGSLPTLPHWLPSMQLIHSPCTGLSRDEAVAQHSLAAPFKCF